MATITEEQLYSVNTQISSAPQLTPNGLWSVIAPLHLLHQMIIISYMGIDIKWVYDYTFC